MSKEAAGGDRCACGQLIAFPVYHWPRCPANPDNLSREDRAHMETKFSKRDLAIIAAHGSKA